MAKYKLQESGVFDTETGASIPDSLDNRYWVEYQDWLTAGNTVDPQFTAQELVDTARAGKIQDVKNEGLIRIQAGMPAITDFDVLELVREQWLSVAPAARTATANFQVLIDNYQAARDAVIFLKSATDNDVANYDVLTSPSWQ